MKIGIVGTFIRDRIFPFKGEPQESIGGIFFTVSFLANLVADGTEIYPISFVGEDFYDLLVERLSEYKNIRLDGVKKITRKHTQVKLVYTAPQERYEITTEPMPPLTFSELETVNDADAALVNLITGVDVDLSALAQFRKQSPALLYLDFHTRAMGINEVGRRYYRRPDDWQDWIKLTDVLQLNEMEARTLAGLGIAASGERLLEFGKGCLEIGPQVCHITLAEQGSLLFDLHNSQMRVERIKAFPVKNVVDIIGCGDAFAAGYIVKYFATGDVVQATKFASKVAAINCTFIGSSGAREILNLLHKYDSEHSVHRSTIWRA
ncbi:MAG TPA: carbohydrate kinase family protein [bacterium]